QCVLASSTATKSGKYDFRFIAASVYSMEKPKICGSFAKATTSEHPSKNLANSRSNSLSHGTTLKTVLTPSHNGRDQGNGWHVERSRAGSKSCGSCSSIVKDIRAFLKMSTHTN